MRELIVYVLIALIYKVESRTLCDDPRCVCTNDRNSSQISCVSYNTVLEANYSLPDNVSVLDLSRNNLTRVERSPSLASETLRELLLVNNQIKEIGIDALRLPSLLLLDLSHNYLEFIDRDTFVLLKNLERLYLANNKFNAFGNLDLYNLNKLQFISLDNNDIGASLVTHGLFKGGYNLTDKVQSISLRNVNLNSENKNIFMTGTNNLKNLSIAQNNMRNIINLPPSLEYVDISSNPIEKITPSNFLFSINLRVLKLNNILLKEVPDYAFFYISSLVSLELANNTRLKWFSPLAWGRVIPHDQTDLFVENLILRNASLTSLDSQLRGIFKKIGRVDLRDNPWRCDCELSWLQDIPIPKEIADFRCSTPPNLFNRTIPGLNKTEFICEQATPPPSGFHLKTSINVLVYCTLLVLTVLMMYFFIFSPRPFMYRQLPVEFPRTP